MSSEHACEICGEDWGGRVVPTIFKCCGEDVCCFDCAEKHRNAKIAELTGNRKMIKCMFCNALFHCSKGTQWIVNKTAIRLSRIEVDLTAVREAQAAMQVAPAPKRRRRNNQEMSQQAETQDMEGGGGGEEANSTSEDPPPSASRWVRRSSRAISRARPRENPPTTPSPQHETAVVVGRQRRPEDVQINLDAGSLIQRNDTGPSVAFTKQAFLSNNLFHLNPMINAKKKKNKAFGLFVREGLATLLFDPLPAEVDADTINSWSYSELRDFLIATGGDYGRHQTAMWLKYATPGSFVVMRHEYPNCKFCPKRLKESGRYIGPVYVIGVVERHVGPRSAEERDIARNGMREVQIRWDVNTLARVDWKWMGYKKNLKQETQRYLNLICQPTLQQICKQATMQCIREDLWENATVEISPEEFPERFDFRKEPNYHP